MLYIIFGNQPFTVQYHIKRIAKETLVTPDEMNFIRMDASEVSLQDIIDETTQIPLGYDKKVVSAEKCDFLIKVSKTQKESKEYKDFLSFLEGIDEETTLILSTYEDAVDVKSDVVKIVKEKGQILELGKVSEAEWFSYVASVVSKSGATIDKDAINELAKRTSGDVALLRNEVAKLSLYTDHITYNDINLMVEKPLEENVFLIFNNLISQKEDFAIKVYRDLITQNIEPVRVITTLANQFRLLHEVKYLASNKTSVKEIANILNIKETRVNIIARQVYNISDQKIRNTLNALYELDYQIKSGQVDRYYALELFLIKFNQN